jgi:glucose-1-phosphate adenylyltransferase
MKTDVVALILAGGRGTRLNLIAAKRAKPAVPFAGMFRIIDFTLTNVMVSEVRHVGVLTQYRPTSLMDHLGDGDSWDLSGVRASLQVLPPSLGRAHSDWYRGTADAVYQNIGFLRALEPRDVLILSGDHIYSMDFRPMIERHRASGADLTIAAMEVPWEEVSRFGVMKIDADDNITEFIEKSPERTSNIANMGIYIFRREALLEELHRNCPEGRFDFGAHVIPGMLGRRKILAHRFSGYWRDVGTLGSYWSANMDALDPSTGLDLSAWRARTNLDGRMQVFHPAAVLAAGSHVRNSLVSRGCVIEGEVTGSVLSPGVRVGRGARVVDSVVMHDVTIEKGASVERAILDKDVTVGAGTRLGRADARGGMNEHFPTHLSDGITVVGKGTNIPANAVIGANVLIGTEIGDNRLVELRNVPDGGTVA